MKSEEILNAKGMISKVTPASRAVVVLHMMSDTNVEIQANGQNMDLSFLLAQFHVFMNEILSGRLKVPQPTEGSAQ